MGLLDLFRRRKKKKPEEEEKPFEIIEAPEAEIKERSVEEKPKRGRRKRKKENV